MKHNYLYWEFSEANAGQAVREGRWKAIHFFAKGNRPERIELYDLADDLGETHNIAAEQPAVVKRLRHYMDEAHRPSPRFPLPPDRHSL